MATTSRPYPNAGDWLAFRKPQVEWSRPSDPSADGDVPSEREAGHEIDRGEPDDRARDLAETA